MTTLAETQTMGEQEWLSQRTPDDPFLQPIEHPKSFLMRIVFYFTRRQFGKVLAPLKVFAARMPTSFGQYYGKAYKLDKKLQLPLETQLLIREQVAKNNVCLFCMDATRWAVGKYSMNMAKFDALESYTTSPLFTERERVALEYATQLTHEKRVDPDTFRKLASYFTEREICEIVWLVASEHLSNMTNIGLNVHSDTLCKTAIIS